MQEGTVGANECCVIDTMRYLNNVCGDNWKGKEEDEIVCVGLNVNGLRKDMWKEKNNSLRNFLHQRGANLVALQEINLHWNKLDSSEQWHERSTGWWEGGQCSSIAFNVNDPLASATQPRGCMAISSGLTKRRIIQKGIDERNLGRWAWIKFQGKMNRTVRFISARQCGSNVGLSTIFSQQRSYFDKEGDNRHPREMFQKEMCELLNKWKNEGDVIVMSVDANEHATTGESSFKLHQLGLVEVITTKHEESSGIAPTYHGGQDPIDGIFVSSNVNIVQAGCRPFGEAPSDHRAL